MSSLTKLDPDLARMHERDLSATGISKADDVGIPGSFPPPNYWPNPLRHAQGPTAPTESGPLVEYPPWLRRLFTFTGDVAWLFYMERMGADGPLQIRVLRVWRGSPLGEGAAASLIVVLMCRHSLSSLSKSRQAEPAPAAPVKGKRPLVGAPCPLTGVLGAGTWQVVRLSRTLSRHQHRGPR